MNFKPTRWKSIVSILVIIIVDLFLANSGIQVACIFAAGVEGACQQPSWYKHIFDPVPVLVSLIIGLIIYFIWSLFQKRKK